jgi:hypothetical protein
MEKEQVRNKERENDENKEGSKEMRREWEKRAAGNEKRNKDTKNGHKV